MNNLETSQKAAAVAPATEDESVVYSGGSGERNIYI